MKLQRAFFLVIALAFVVSLGSLLVGGDNQKAQVVSGTNSVGVTAPPVGTTIYPGQEIPMTCEVETAPGYQIRDLVFAWFQNNGAQVGNFIVDEEGLPTDAAPLPSGTFTRVVTIPSITPGSNFKLQCVAYFNNSGGSATQSILMNFVSAPVPIPGCTDPSATNYNPNATVSDSSCTYPAPDTIAPSIPTGLLIGAQTSYQMTVNWSPSTDNVGVVSYKIYRNYSGGTTTAVNTTTPITTVNAPTTYYRDNGLVTGRTYKYRIVAVDAAGNVSALSATVSGATIAVNPPLSVTVGSATTSSLAVSWAPPISGDIQDYAIYSNYANGGGTSSVNTTTSVGVVPFGTNSFVHNGLTAGTSYKYRVAARDPANNRSNLTTQKTGTTLTNVTPAPTAPSNLSATANGSTMSLAWTDNSNNETGFTLERATNSSFTSGLATVSSTIAVNATSYSITSGLTAGTTYYFRVKANATTPSSWSNVASATLPVVPPADTTAPTASITAPTAGQILPAGTTSTTLSATTNEASTCKWSATDVSYSSMTNSMTASGGTSHSATLTGLANGTSYTRYVRCQDTAGNAMTASQSRSFSVAAPVDTTAPAVPTLAAGPVTSTTIDLSWNAVTDPSAPVTYKVYRNGTYIGTPISGTSMTDNGLTSGTTYSYTISSCDSAPGSNCSAQSTSVSATTTAIPTIVSSLQVVQTNGTVVSTLAAGQQLNVGSQANATYAPLGGAFSIKANPGTPAPSSIKFELTGPTGFTAYTQCESSAPYSLFGDTGATAFTSWPASTQILGPYTLTTTPYAATTCTGAAGTPVVNQFLLANFDDATPPTNPSSVSATYRSGSEMRISWVGSTDASGINHYEVTRNPGNTTDVGNQTTYIDTTGLNATTAYTYTVTAVDSFGNTSGVSNAYVSPTLSTNFTNGDQIETNVSTNVKSTPDATGNIGTQGAGVVGAVTNAPTGATNPVWTTGGAQYWYVNFAAGTDGWVNQNNIDPYVPPPTDTTPPVASITAPTAGQVLVAGTTTVTLSVTTNEAATCKWGTTDMAYSSMANTFTGSGSTSHTYPLLGLTDGTSYTRYVRCQDVAGNAMSSSQSVSFSVAIPADTTAPTVTITAPTANQVLAAGTTSVSLTATTSEAGTCKWDVNNVAYGSMPNTFTGSGTTSHNYPLLGLTDGTSYTRYVACADLVGNASATQSRTFSVASLPPAGDPVVNTTCPATMPTLENDARNASRLSVQLCAQVSESTTPKTITLKWASVTGRTVSGITVYRKTESGSWTSVGTPAATATSWTDSSVSTGTYYEYKVQMVTSSGTVYGYIASGIKVPQEAYRGRLVLVIDNTKASGTNGSVPTGGSLATQVTQLINDLNGDKWVVTPVYVSPTATPGSVRTLIKGYYDADAGDGNSTTNTKAVYLFGHVPVAGIGNINPDGHGARGISSDQLYGEMTGTWNTGSVSSSSSYGVSASFSMPSTNTYNNPSPDAVELQVGRVDMYDIPGLPGTENEKLQNYLTKASNFKKRLYVPSDSVYIRARTPYVATGIPGWSSMAPVVGISNVTHDRSLNDSWQIWNQNYLFALGYGQSGSLLATHTIYQPLLCTTGCTSSNNLSNQTWGGVFNILSSSYVVEWNDTNSILKSVLADEGRGLTMSYGINNHWYFHPMGMGKTVGYASKESINNSSSNYYPRGLTGGWDDASSGSNPQGHMTLLGDPTLRAHYVSGPSNLSVTNSGGLASFSWFGASNSPLGYNIYEVQSNLVRKVNSNIITGTSYASSDTYSAGNKYMVTAVKVQAGNSGTYYNESLGAIAGGAGGQPLSDTTPPVATITAPTASQVLAVDTTSTTLAVTTDEAATCKWSTTDQAYSSMPNTFTVTGLIAHTATLSSLANGTSYTRYVRCQDTQSNAMTTSVSVSFSVAAIVPPPPPGGTVMGINGAVGPSLTSNPTSCTNPSGGTIYYVDGTAGDDTKAGTTTATAWKTIDKVNSSMGSITSGKMVCFKRGNTYRGKLAISSSGTASAPIIFDAYGTGTAPVISGGTLVTGWTQHSGNIYKATVATPFTTPKYLFINGEYATLARQPNTGFYTTSSTNGTSITDSGNSWLSAQAAGSLTGARLLSRRTPWSFDLATITGNSGSTISVASLPYGTGVGSGWATSDWGYLVQNKLSLLDAAGEWYFDSGTNTVYLWAPGSVNPSTLSVELASYDRAISLSSGKTDLIIRNLAVGQTNEYAVYTSQNKRMILENLEISKAESGIRHYTMNGNAAADRNIIRNNHIHDMNLQGLYLQGGNDHLIEGNVVEDISTVEERLSDSAWAHFGVYITDSGSNNTLRRNIFRDIGYIGITGAGGGLITENLIERPLQILTDGGGIAFDYTNGMTISKNIVRDSYSNMSTMPTTPYIGYIPLAKGIYFGDKDIKNTTVDSNVIIDVESDGIWMDHSLSFTGNRVTNNIIHGFTRAGIGLSDYSIYTAFPANGCDPKTNSPCFLANFNDVVTDNKIYGLASDENPLYMLHVYSNGSSGFSDFGTIDRNYYGNPYRATKVQQQKLFAGTTNSWTLAQWQANSAEDDNSTSATYTATAPAQIFYNATPSNITQSVNGCNISGTQTIAPFTAIVVEYGNC